MPLPKYSKIEKSGIPQQYILDLAVLIKKFSNDNSLKYLEVGAFDGIQQSNTLCLKSKPGWSGLLVEPIKEYFQLLKQNRPQDVCVNALMSSGGSEDLMRIRKAGPMSQVIDDNDKNRISFRDWAMAQLRRILFWRQGLRGGH